MSLVCLNLSESVVPHIAERLCPCRYFTIVFAFCEVAQRKQRELFVLWLISGFREWLRKINAIK